MLAAPSSSRMERCIRTVVHDDYGRWQLRYSLLLYCLRCYARKIYTVRRHMTILLLVQRVRVQMLTLHLASGPNLMPLVSGPFGVVDFRKYANHRTPLLLIDRFESSIAKQPGACEKRVPMEISR